MGLRRCVDDSVSWARLEFAGSSSFDDFVASLDRGGDAQLFDFSIWQHCARSLGSEVKIPKWFCVDLFSLVSSCMQPVSGSASPTLFVAAAGTSSGLHVDFLQTRFWMTL